MKKHTTKLLQIFFIAFVLLFNSANAQQHFVAYNLDYLPQRMYANPALLPISRVNIGIPGISSIYMNMGNTGFKIADVMGTHGDSTYMNMASLISKLKKHNYLGLNMDLDLISFGFRVKNNYFSFNATEKVDFNFRYPKDFFDFIWQGNGAFLGQEKKFDFGINAQHYREYGFGFARNIDDKLTVGAKLKFLYGMENIYTKKSDIGITTDPTDFSIKATSDVLIHTSGIVMDSTNNGGGFSKYALGRKNTGLGIDLGGVYKLNSKIILSASLIDFGMIKWRSNVTSYQSKDPGASYEFKGLEFDVFKSSTVSLSDLSTTALDSMSKKFQIEEKKGGSYTTLLPSKIYLGGNYLFGERQWAGVLLYGQLFDKSLRSGLTLSYSTHVGKVLSSSVTYSIYNRSYNNFGLGFTVNAGPVQLYLISDNLIGLMMYNRYSHTDGSSTILPAYTKTINIHFGLQLTFGRKDKDKDKDGTPDKTDLCPEIRGSKELSGCPDKDNDKVADKNDDCPEKPGVAALKGCPDSDSDGIKDDDDACPTVAGPAYTKGCPDTDNDSIPDKDDKCPDKVGSRENEGCPLVKMIMKDKDGKVLGVALIDKEGKFVFEKLPGDQNVFFTMEGEDIDIGKIKLLIGGKEKSLVKKDGLMVIKDPSLQMFDANGNLIGVAVKDKDGVFVFEKLPGDQNVFFRMEGEDIGIGNLKIMIDGQNRKLVSKGGGNLMLEQIDNTPANPENVVEVKLETKEKEVVKTAFDNLEFEAGKEVIKKESYPSLFELASLMKKNPDWILRIAGHTDKTGTEAANLALSQKRADAVKKFLLLSGITDAKFIVESFGSSKPIADNKTPEGRQKNRRVEMTIVEKK